MNLSSFSISKYGWLLNISSSEISIDNQNDVIVGKGNVEVTDSEGKTIKSENVIFEYQPVQNRFVF